MRLDVPQVQIPIRTDFAVRSAFVAIGSVLDRRLLLGVVPQRVVMDLGEKQTLSEKPNGRVPKCPIFRSHQRVSMASLLEGKCRDIGTEVRLELPHSLSLNGKTGVLSM